MIYGIYLRVFQFDISYTSESNELVRYPIEHDELVLKCLIW